MRQNTLIHTTGMLIALATVSACGGGDSASQIPASSPTVLLASTSAPVPNLAAAPEPAAAAAAATINMTVALDGSGQYTTLKQAFAAVVENNTLRTIITIKPGTYDGQAILTRNKHNVTLQGSDAKKTIIRYSANVNEQPAGTDNFYKGFGVVIEGNNFKADKLTFQNSSGDHGQAIALRLNGDRSVITNSRFLGWQDTLMVNNGRHYFKNCYVEGRVDFIYGSGTAVFDTCEIKSKNGGYITASSAPQERAYGFVFINSKLTSDPKPWVDPNSTTPVVTPATPPQAFLGRPWRPYASVIFLNTNMGSHIKSVGWNNWGNAANELTARYAESGSWGAGANDNARVKWSKILSKADADKLTVTTILGGTDNWKPQ